MPVKDLQPADFEVLEDGVPQTIGSFRGIFEDSSGPGAAAEAAPAAAPAPPAVGPRPDPKELPVTALVFDRLSPEAQGLAVHAAKSYFGGKNRQQAPTYVGVFSIEGSLRPVTPFTRNVEQIEKGLDEMQSRASASFGIDREHKRQVDQQAEASQQTVDAATSAGGRGGAGMGSSPATAQLAQMESRMLTNFEALERDQQGYSQVNSLFAIIEALRPLPGRKSVMSGGSCTFRYATAGSPIGGRRPSPMNIIRTISERQASFGRTSGGGNLWQVLHVARASLSSSDIPAMVCA